MAWLMDSLFVTADELVNKQVVDGLQLQYYLQEFVLLVFERQNDHNITDQLLDYLEVAYLTKYACSLEQEEKYEAVWPRRT